MNAANTSSDYQKLEKQFLELTTCQDAKSKAAECTRLAKPLLYSELCDKIDTATTSIQCRELMMQFRKMCNYNDSEEKAAECEQKAREIEQSQEWENMGRCYRCGGKLSFFSKKCKSCGHKN